MRWSFQGGDRQPDRSAEPALVLGYTVGNDVSARDLQRSGPKGNGSVFCQKPGSHHGCRPWCHQDEFPQGSPKLRRHWR